MAKQIRSAKFVGNLPTPYSTDELVTGANQGGLRVLLEILDANEGAFGVPSVRITPKGGYGGAKPFEVPYTAVLGTEPMPEKVSLRTIPVKVVGSK